MRCDVMAKVVVAFVLFDDLNFMIELPGPLRAMERFEANNGA